MLNQSIRSWNPWWAQKMPPSLTGIRRDVQELNEETKKEIESAIKEIKSGKYITHEKLAREMGF